jgi:hypothetical protein
LRVADGKEMNSPVVVAGPPEPEIATGNRQLALILLNDRSGTGLTDAVGNDEGDWASRGADAVVALDVECAPESVQPAAMSMTNATATALIPKT